MRGSAILAACLMPAALAAAADRDVRVLSEPPRSLTAEPARIEVDGYRHELLQAAETQIGRAQQDAQLFRARGQGTPRTTGPHLLPQILTSRFEQFRRTRSSPSHAQLGQPGRGSLPDRPTVARLSQPPRQVNGEPPINIWPFRAARSKTRPMPKSGRKSKGKSKRWTSSRPQR